MKKIKDYLTFNSRERLAIILLICLMTIFWLLPEIIPSKPISNNLESEQVILPNNAKDFARDSSDPRFSTYPLAKEKEAIEPIKYFVFNPNTIDAKQWQSLGLSNKTVQTILNYRNKGGTFRKPEDIRKIWGLQPDLAEQLIPYIQIPDVTKTKEAVSFKKERTDSFVVKKEVTLKKLNINTATEDDWRAFPGIGKVLAARIIKFREKIGGFNTVEQVGKTYGIPDSVFQKMLPYLQIDGNIPEK